MRVLIESPYAAPNQAWVNENLSYLGRAMKHQLLLGHYPFASHGLYTMPGCLDDTVIEERTLGIAAGLKFAECCEVTCVYFDRGISPGMIQGVKDALGKRPLLFISLDGKSLGEVHPTILASMGIHEPDVRRMQETAQNGDRVDPSARWYLLPTAMALSGLEVLKRVA